MNIMTFSIQTSKRLFYLKLLCIVSTISVLSATEVKKYNLDKEQLSNLDIEQYEQNMNVNVIPFNQGAAAFTVANLNNTDQENIQKAMGKNSLEYDQWFKYLLAFYKKKNIGKGYKHVKISMNGITFNICEHQVLTIGIPTYPFLKKIITLTNGYMRENNIILPKSIIDIVVKYRATREHCTIVPFDCYYFDMQVKQQGQHLGESKKFICISTKNIQAAWKQEKDSFYNLYSLNISDPILTGIVYGVHQTKNKMKMFRFVATPLFNMSENTKKSIVVVRSKNKEFKGDVTIKEMRIPKLPFGQPTIKLVKNFD